MNKTNRFIVGSALGLAAITVAIDHTKHRLPDPVSASQEQYEMSDDDESPCGMSSESPCSMDSDDSASPCSMDVDTDDEASSPCGLGD